jgi:hypothetical protein
VRDVVERVRQIPYGRNTDRSPAGVLAEGRGTCSTKHALLVHLLADRPELDLRFVHRVYRVDREGAERLFGADAPAAVPKGGLVDVHTFLTADIDGRRTTIDVTFPSDQPWNGTSDMPLACGEGEDYPVDGDPWALKGELVATHCDPAVREPFIAALSTHDQ